MRFVCLGYFDEKGWERKAKEEQERLMEECLAYDEILWRDGHWTDRGEALQGTSTAKTLRHRDGRTVVTDGPYAETKEVLGGIGVLEAKDMAEAIELISKHPGLKMGPFEIRPADETVNAMLNERFRAAQAKGSGKGPSTR
ncbi:MAG TPA: YciI family protein [Candidatus Polarisedimenticolia bacterium]|nr:YciI family protein [Candidatus Polarisedimenticolia bacterium]